MSWSISKDKVKVADLRTALEAEFNESVKNASSGQQQQFDHAATNAEAACRALAPDAEDTAEFNVTIGGHKADGDGPVPGDSIYCNAHRAS